MKNTKFLKIIDFFKNFTKGFKSKNKVNNLDLNDLLKALHNNDLNKANKVYSQFMDIAILNSLAAKIIKNGNLNDFISLIQKVPNDKDSQHSFYQKSFIYAIYEDNEQIFKYIFDNNHLTLEDLNYKHLLKFISDKDAYKIASFVLYDLKFEVTKEMKDVLICDNNGKTHTKILDLIEKRDLYFELNDNLDIFQKNEKIKKNKI